MEVLASLSGVRGQSRERQVRWMGEQGPDLEGQGGCVTPSYGHGKCPGLPVPGPALHTIDA